ncbi:hypothetical protein [Streptomyces sp. SAI-229]|jgi:uncharacterized membrane-anchored protein YjiN (DUF445 family)|uniref:hypothetical protein n=1 Tax=Streptomyces sp. SAI-229 TaxID=3377731 RepID=UPI003C7C05D0
MDPIVLATASVLVHAMSTDAWPQVRAAMVTLWRRARPEQADAVEAELEEAREVLLADRDSGDEAVKAGLAADWQGRVWRLLVEDPSLADELRRILNDAAALLTDEQARTNTITQHARVSGNSWTYQAGRDLHITEGAREDSAVGNTPPGPPLGDDDDEW